MFISQNIRFCSVTTPTLNATFFCLIRAMENDELNLRQDICSAFSFSRGWKFHSSSEDMRKSESSSFKLVLGSVEIVVTCFGVIQSSQTMTLLSENFYLFNHWIFPLRIFFNFNNRFLIIIILIIDIKTTFIWRFLN